MNASVVLSPDKAWQDPRHVVAGARRRACSSSAMAIDQRSGAESETKREEMVTAGLACIMLRDSPSDRSRRVRSHGGAVLVWSCAEIREPDIAVGARRRRCSALAVPAVKRLTPGRAVPACRCTEIALGVSRTVGGSGKHLPPGVGSRRGHPGTHARIRVGLDHLSKRAYVTPLQLLHQRTPSTWPMLGRRISCSLVSTVSLAAARATMNSS